MIKSRIFYYELRRAVFSKIYLFLLLLVFAYSLYTIKTTVLRGFANTAPFSEWTFMQYLLTISPFLSAVLLFYVCRLFSPYEKNVMQITSSMPFSGPMYFLIKLTVVTLAYLLAASLSIAACFVFYGTVFAFFDLCSFTLCILLVLFPQMLFLLGMGIWMSRLTHTLAYVLIGLMFFLSLIKLTPPYCLDIPGSSILQIAEGALPIKGSIPFWVPFEFSISRAALCLLGLLLTIGGCLKYKSSSIKK